MLVASLAVPLAACGEDEKKNEKKDAKGNPFDPASRIDANMTDAEKKELQDAAKKLSGE
jgi:hypothetical protein